MAQFGHQFGQMKRFSLGFLEKNEPYDALQGTVHRSKTLQNAVVDSELTTDREYDMMYFDKPMNEWERLDDDTERGDMLDVPKFACRFKSPKKVFSASAFLRRDGRFKKFVQAELPFEKLFIPQEQALLKMQRVLGAAPGGARFMCICPTGVGKTVIMALSPFMLESSKVLYIMPGKTLRDQAARSIKAYFSNKHPLGRTGDVRAETHLFSTEFSSSDFTADAIVTNIHALVFQPKKDVGEHAGEEMDAGEEMPLRSAARLLLRQHKPDLVVIDEGHHFPASSWEDFSAAALGANPDCKFVLLTATPQRGDAASYGLTDVRTEGEEFFYKFSRKQAIADKYIKEINYRPQAVSFQKPESRDRYIEPAYVKSIIKPAVDKLLELRKSCNDVPLRLLVGARTNEHANKIAALINQWSAELGWNLLARALTGATKEVNEETLTCFKRLVPKIVDIVVQVKMLGEGYDNSLIAVTAAVAPAKTVSTLSQFHGRAVRKPSAEYGLQDWPLAMKSYMFYPIEKDVQKVVDGYEEGDDESIDSLFAPRAFKSLKHAHTSLGKMTTSDFVEKMRENFVEYHEYYEERRVDWKPVPAEQVAIDIYKSFIGDKGVPVKLRIADLGCGPDGLFENKLAELVENRDASGEVYVLALDVEKLRCAKTLTEEGAKPKDGIDASHTTFTCDTHVGDYNTIKELKLAAPFDAGVFCLSLMASDALESGLIAASTVIKARGTIYVVVDPWKLDINPRQKETMEAELQAWCDAFLVATGFVVSEKYIKGSVPFIYLQLINIGRDELAKLPSKLGGVTFKTLRSFKASSQLATPAGECEQAGPSGVEKKRKLAEDPMPSAA